MISTEKRSSSRKNKILLVEDSSDMRKALALRLKALGYEVLKQRRALMPLDRRGLSLLI
jgi:DNA-binding response OmpR family regulator